MIIDLLTTSIIYHCGGCRQKYSLRDAHIPEWCSLKAICWGGAIVGNNESLCSELKTYARALSMSQKSQAFLRLLAENKSMPGSDLAAEEIGVRKAAGEWIGARKRRN
jgi:hypothetical protein